MEEDPVLFEGPVYELSKPSYLFPFEKGFDHMWHIKWMTRYWTIVIPIAVTYVGAIKVLENYMKTRKAYSLRVPLIIWNWALALLSLMPVVRGIPVSYELLSRHDLYMALCSKSFMNIEPIPFWGFIYGWTKVLELGDTVFLALRKRHISFLHIYHHATVMFICFFWSTQISATIFWVALMNYVVHVFMYSYFALRAMGYRIPKGIAMALTILQISQMALGMFIHIRATRYLNQGVPCGATYGAVLSAFLLYFSYFVLFVQFFIASYIKSGGKWSVRHLQMHKPMVGKID